MCTLISSHEGHLVHNDKDLKNPYEIWKDKDGLMFVKMHSKLGSFIFDYDDFEHVTMKSVNDEIKKITWLLIKKRIVFYVKAHFSGKTIYLHQHIAGHHGHGCSGVTVDHIDRNPLNNRRSNLRLASISLQISNRNKPSRKKSAHALPDGISQNDLPKYVNYTYAVRDTKFGYVEFFQIQGHPTLKNKTWCTQKSCQVSIYDKLKQVLDKIKELDLNEIKQQNQIAGTS